MDVQYRRGPPVVVQVAHLDFDGAKDEEVALPGFAATPVIPISMYEMGRHWGQARYHQWNLRRRRCIPKPGVRGHAAYPG